MHYVPYLEGRFHTASPDSQGVPSGAILQFLTELDRLDVDLHSLYIFRNGFQLLGANRRPYQGDTPRRIYSAAKALTGLAVLFAIQEGLVSLKTRLTQLFPEDLPETVTPRMESITVYHLLTMTTGHDRDTFRPVLNSTNSVRAFLEEPLDFEPGTHFLYNNGVPHILGLIVKKVSGINYLDFLRPRFLEPLGIYCTVEQTQRGELEGSRTMCTAEGLPVLSSGGQLEWTTAAGRPTGAGSCLLPGPYPALLLYLLHAQRPAGRLRLPALAQRPGGSPPGRRPQSVRFSVPGQGNGHRLQRH